MKNLTLIIPTKKESESLPIFLREIKNLICKKMVVLQTDDNVSLDSIKGFNSLIFFLIGWIL